MLRASLVAALVVAGCTSSPHWSLPLPSLDRVPLSVTQSSPSDVWVVGGALGSGGNAFALHYDGRAWQRTDLATDATLWWVAERGSELWAVGERGTVMTTPDFAVEAVPTTATLYGVWPSQSGTVWVVGGEPDLSGVILRRVGGAWQDLSPPGATGAFFKVWGAADDDVWIVGQGGAILHWNGAALGPVESAVDARTPLLTVAGRAADDVYAVGGLGNAVVVHYDGSGWTRLSDPAFDSAPGLAGVSVDADGTAFLVGSGGTKLRGHVGAWSDETAEATRVDLHAVSLAGGNLFTVGGNYQAPAPTPRQGLVAHFGADVSSTIN